MILVCTQCKASYLIPATVFAHGPRQVRCARCHFTWQADLPSKLVVMPTESAAAAPKAPASGPERPVKRDAGEGVIEETRETVVTETTFIFTASKLPAIWRNPLWKKVRIGGAIAAGVLAVGLLGWVAVGGAMPGGLGPLLAAIGLGGHGKEEGLVLQNIRSERRFEDGGMQLVVEGEVRNNSGATQPVPGIQAKAMGPDRAVIQSWRIEAPVATLPPGAFAPFHSSIVAPEGSVTEVNLSFAEPSHE